MIGTSVVIRLHTEQLKISFCWILKMFFLLWGRQNLFFHSLLLMASMSVAWRWNLTSISFSSPLCCWISNKATGRCSANFSSFFFLIVSWWTYFDPPLLLAHWSWRHVPFAAAVQKQKGNEMRRETEFKEREREGWFSCHYLRAWIEEPKSPKCQAVWPVSSTTHKTLRF